MSKYFIRRIDRDSAHNHGICMYGQGFFQDFAQGGAK